MMELTIKALEAEIDALKDKLDDANNIIEAIKEGAVDALLLTKEGIPQVYTMESTDFTYRILIEKFGEGALSISPDGLILYCNNYFSLLIGIPATEITGTYINKYIHSVYEFEMLKHALESGPSKGEIFLKTNVRKIPVYVSLTDLQPNVPAIGMIVTDLTQKKKHDESLELYQRQLETKVDELNKTNLSLGEFIHVVSHDIKEPIRKIIIYTSHLNSKTNSISPEDNSMLHIINSSAHRLNSLVDDLVKYAFTSVRLEMVNVDLNRVLTEVKDDLEYLIRDKKATVIIDDLPGVLGSVIQMRQLFSNLIANAIKYSKENIDPVIQIKSERVVSTEILGSEKHFIKISVIDNGIGMDKEHLTKIFTIFQRLHNRNEYSGNGIGLAICKKIMENHDGKIDVSSSPDVGSTFNIYIPYS